jgi:hypothetical protein
MTSQRIKQEVKPVDFLSSYPLFNLELIHYPSIIIYQFSSKNANQWCFSLISCGDTGGASPQLSWLFQKTLTSSMYHKPTRIFLCKPQLSDSLNQLYQIISTINPHFSWFFITVSVSFPNKHGREKSTSLHALLSHGALEGPEQHGQDLVQAESLGKVGTRLGVTLWQSNIDVENHHVQWVNQLFLRFYGYFR